MCGLIGFNGKKPADPTKLKLIACFNESRGKHSCGIYSAGKLEHGVDKMKLISDFLQSYNIPLDKKDTTVIMHTRQATMGIHNKSSAHPFLFEEGERKMILAHNGTLKDVYNLASNHNRKFMDFEVDSKLLGDIIFHDGFEVLKQYKGAANLLIYDNQESNSLKVWKGGAGDEEERPLWYLKQPEGCYFSSMIEPLIILSNKDTNEHDQWLDIFALKNNTLYTFKDGEISKALIYDRGKELSEKFIPSYNTNTNTMGFTTTSEKKIKNLGVQLGSEEEKLLTSSYSNNIYWRNGRYFRNGHVVTGCFNLNEKGLIGEEEYYFFEGVMLSSKDDLRFLEVQKDNKSVNILDVERFAIGLHSAAGDKMGSGNPLAYEKSSFSIDYWLNGANTMEYINFANMLGALKSGKLISLTEVKEDDTDEVLSDAQFVDETEKPFEDSIFNPADETQYFQYLIEDSYDMITTALSDFEAAVNNLKDVLNITSKDIFSALDLKSKITYKRLEDHLKTQKIISEDDNNNRTLRIQ